MKTTTTIELNKANVDSAIAKIVDLANDNRMILKGDTNFDGELEFPSNKKRKSFIKKLNGLVRHRVTKRKASLFLSLLRKYNAGFDLRIELSEREKEIQAARKAWVDARNNAQKALAAYKSVKGDYYK